MEIQEESIRIKIIQKLSKARKFLATVFIDNKFIESNTISMFPQNWEYTLYWQNEGLLDSFNFVGLSSNQKTIILDKYFDSVNNMNITCIHFIYLLKANEVDIVMKYLSTKRVQENLLSLYLILPSLTDALQTLNLWCSWRFVNFILIYYISANHKDENTLKKNAMKAFRKKVGVINRLQITKKRSIYA